LRRIQQGIDARNVVACVVSRLVVVPVLEIVNRCLPDAEHR
jgi:hypothetical protein